MTKEKTMEFEITIDVLGKKPNICKQCAFLKIFEEYGYIYTECTKVDEIDIGIDLSKVVKCSNFLKFLEEENL
jgi:hypothetical protein